jgi:hypothetical protein
MNQKYSSGMSYERHSTYLLRFLDSYDIKIILLKLKLVLNLFNTMTGSYMIGRRAIETRI